jgi:hypothetical protein
MKIVLSSVFKVLCSVFEKTLNRMTELKTHNLSADSQAQNKGYFFSNTIETEFMQ